MLHSQRRLHSLTEESPDLVSRVIVQDKQLYPLGQLVHEVVDVCRDSAGPRVVNVQESIKLTMSDAIQGSQVPTELLKDCSPFNLTTGDGGPSADYEHEFGRVWEVDQGEDQIVDVQGRLCKRIAFWEHELKTTHPLFEFIQEGYKLPLLRVRSVFYKDNAKSATGNSEFVTDAIIELCKNRCIQKVESRPHICSPILVVSNSQGKKRLVLNLRYLNQFLFKEKV